MAVVNEPPWLNQASGIAARNGTTSHTVDFGFTAAPGNFLVVVVYGPVTHTAAGWTERLQAVNTGELSVFTKTSDGDASITVTHNGSNYPMPWVAYELPAGTAWTAGVGSNSTLADTFPQLSGLPGTAQVVFAARGRAAPTPSSTSASSTVTAPWVEDADLFVVDDPTTDGAYLHVMHQINVTAASVTPDATPTYGGSWSTERQHAVFALNVPVADTVAPSVPTGLAVTAFGSSTADLTWLASTDNVGVTAYEVVIVGP